MVRLDIELIRGFLALPETMFCVKILHSGEQTNSNSWLEDPP